MELWVLLAVLTGVLFGVQSIFLKMLSVSLPQTVILKYLFLIAGIFLLPAIFFSTTIFKPGPFFTSFFISLSLNIVAYSLLLKAIRQYPVSVVMPFVGLTPLFLTVTSYLILGESLTSVKVVGIVLIVSGAFILQLPKDWQIKDWKHAFNWQEKGIWLMVLVAFIWSITASVEKIAVNSSSPEFYGATIHLALGMAFIVLERWGKRGSEKRKPSLPASETRTKQGLLGLGLVSAALAWCQLVAIKITYVSYVIAFKRAGVLVSTLLAFFILKERNYVKALTGTFLIVLGATLITL